MLRTLPAVVDQHAENAAFLWLLRDRAVLAPHITLANLVELDARVDAHLDGLRFAREAGWQVCRDALSAGDSGEVFAASVLAFESSEAARLDEVLAVVASKPRLPRAMTSALGWLAPEDARRAIDRLNSSPSPLHRRIGLAGAAVHRAHPGRALESALQDLTDPALTSRALRAVGELGLKELRPQVRAHLHSQDDSIRFAAAWSAGLLGEREAVPVLGALVAGGGPYAASACLMGLKCLSVRDAHKAHDELAARPGLGRLAIVAAAATGDPGFVDWLLAEMRLPAMARLAGEAFATITGADLAHPALAGRGPEGFAAGPTDDPGDDNVEPDPDEHLAWPDPDKLRDWWFDYRGEFRSGTRYLLGNPVDEPWLREVLVTGTQRIRRAAALELALARPGSVLFEVRAPGAVQQHQLKARS